MGSSLTAGAADDAGKPVLEPLELEIFYPYGFQGREMFAARAPHAMSAKAEGLIGRMLRVGGKLYTIRAVHRQISGPIAAQEPIGLEVEKCPSGS